MKKPFDLPTPAEIAKIAAALPNDDAVNQPAEAVKHALGLWFAAAHELAEAEADDFETNVKKYAPSIPAAIEANARAKAADSLKIAFGKGQKDSEALKWLQEHLPPRYPIKTFPKLEEMWLEFFGENADDLKRQCNEVFLKRFAEKWVERQKRKEAQRKARKRSKKGPPPQEKSHRDNS